jgi:hypothetical protein
MAFTIRALAERGFTGGVPFMPIKAFMTKMPNAKMASPASARNKDFFMV